MVKSAQSAGRTQGAGWVLVAMRVLDASVLEANNAGEAVFEVAEAEDAAVKAPRHSSSREWREVAAKLSQLKLLEEWDDSKMQSYQACLWHTYVHGKSSAQLVAKWLLAGAEETVSPADRLRHLKKVQVSQIAGIGEHDCERILSLAHLLKKVIPRYGVRCLHWVAQNIAIEQYLRDRVPNQHLNVILRCMTLSSLLRIMQDYNSIATIRTHFRLLMNALSTWAGELMEDGFRGYERELLERMFRDICKEEVMTRWYFMMLWGDEAIVKKVVPNEKELLDESRFTQILDSALEEMGNKSYFTDGWVFEPESVANWTSWWSSWVFQTSSSNKRKHNFSQLRRLATASNFNGSGVNAALTAFDPHHETDGPLLAIAAHILAAPLGIKVLLSDQDLVHMNFYNDLAALRRPRNDTEYMALIKDKDFLVHIRNLIAIWGEQTQRKELRQLDLEVLRKLFASIEINPAEIEFLRTADPAQLASDFEETWKPAMRRLEECEDIDQANVPPEGDIAASGISSLF